MATVKVKFSQSSINSKEGRIYYQITHNRAVRQVATEHQVYVREWDEKHRNIIMQHDSGRTGTLMSIQEKIRWDMNRFSRIVMSFTQKGVCFSADDIVEEFLALTSRLSLFNFMESIIARLKHDGKVRTSETYRSALNSFSRFRNDEDVMLDTLNQDMMKSYEAYLQAKGLVPNSISFHLRILRAVYNRACEQGLVAVSVKPFNHVYTGVEKTAKRAVDIKTIRQIKNMDLSMDKHADYARDIFMLSFYLRGISFIDLAYLKKSDLKNGIVSYRRRKTGQKLTVKWTKEMQEILDKYPENETEFLFPVIISGTANHRNQYRQRHYKVNCCLKTVAEKAGLQMPLTTYVARHSWASIAKSKGIPLGIISEGLGHDNEQTTQIYLATLDTSAVDRANDMIMSAL
ncbi:MAG: site-specific integrase [Bacteroidales bacterium]|nr:site-specific integrase [Bacteroidales bacterium]